MAFTTSVLLIPGEKYDTLTTSDSGWVYDVAVEIDQTNALAENNRLSHAPYGLSVSPTEQAQPLITVMLYRGINALNPSVELMDVVRYWGPLLFALSLIPIFLIGKELGGDFGGCAAAFFGATLASSIYWMKVGAYDREPIQLILGVWTIYLTIKLFKAPRSEIPKFALLAGLVYGIFGLSWAGALFIAPIVVGGLLFVLLIGFLGKLIRKTTDLFGAFFSAIREHLSLIAGVLGMLAVMTLTLWVISGRSPTLWVSFGQSLLGYVGIGGGEGISFARYAGEMAAPNSWSDTIDGFYGVGILTTLILILIALALIKFCWSRKRWELLVFPWLIVIAAMVWPGQGQARFERMWWLFVPVLAGVGAAVLASLVRRVSFEQFGEWLKHLQRPIVVALLISIVATPFVFNAYDVAKRTTPPTEWHGVRGLDEGLMEAFGWLRENTPENSVVSIQWSFGHLLTGASQRATVCDGAEIMGKEGKWENDPSFVPRPPDYIYYVQDSSGIIYGVNVPVRLYQINGRRIDVQRFGAPIWAGNRLLAPPMDENEFRWIIGTYRDNWDNYGCKIDYIILDYQEFLSAVNYYTFTQPINILLEAEVIKTELQSWNIEGQNYVFNFGENREDVVLDTQTRGVYLKTDNENLYLDGYGVLNVNEQGQISDYGGFFPPLFTADLSETLLIFLDVNGNIAGAGIIEAVSAEIINRPIPICMRIFQGNLEDIDYLEVVFTSSNGLVKISKVIHENLP